jgi:hypothetical protein
MREDAVHRLLDVWAGGESCASLSRAAARLLDQLGGADPVGRPALESVANVVCPACRAWSITHAPRLMREAASLMGGSGVTADCPGSVGSQWMDSELEAIQEQAAGTALQRLAIALTDELFLNQFAIWTRELREIDRTHSANAAGTLAVAMEAWRWTLDYVQRPSLELAEALCGILANRSLIVELKNIEAERARHLDDLCHIQAVNIAAEAARVCAELIYSRSESVAAFSDLEQRLDESLAGSFAARDRARYRLVQGAIPLPGQAESGD